MKNIHIFIYIALLSLFLTLNVQASDKQIELKKGWNQITVPYDNIKIILLIANNDIEVIWAYQNGKYNLATNILDYKLMAKNSTDIGMINSLSYGESIYILAKEDTTMTFVGTENNNPPVRSNHISSEWKQMSRQDFASTEYNVISRIVEGAPVIVSKIVMSDGRPSLKVYSNDATEASKINPEFFEDFEVGESESFWIKDISSVEDINKFDFSVSGTKPTLGGDIGKFAIDATSINKNRNYLSVNLVAIKDGDFSNPTYTLFNDYIKLNEDTQEIKTIMPMIESGQEGKYRVYAIKDLSAQYDKLGIDLFNIDSTNKIDMREAYNTILENSDYIDVNLVGNNPNAVYDLKIESREYANSVLYYDPLKALNEIAQNQSKDLSELSYGNIGRHTEFQLSLDAYGNDGVAIDTTKIKAYITVGGTHEPIVVLGENGDLKDSYELKDMKISLLEQGFGKELTLSLMMYGTEVLSDNRDLTLYNKVMSELGTEANKICLDTECSQWIFKKEFEVSIAVADTSDHETDASDIIGTTKITLFSDTFSIKSLDNYESKDTVVSLTDILLKENTYYDAIDKRRIGLMGNNGDSRVVINDLEALKIGLENNTDSKSLFDPLATYRTEIMETLIYKRYPAGGIDYTQISDIPLRDAWDAYIASVGSNSSLCNRENYFGLTLPYTKSVNDPNGGNPVSILTATDDLCIYNVKYNYLKTLSTSQIEEIATNFRAFILIKKTRSEADRLGDFWNPLLELNNATLKMPEFLGLTLPVVDKRIGGGAYFSAKMAIDPDLNEFRTAIYADVDLELIEKFKMVDLDLEVVLSGSGITPGRFDFYLYSIEPKTQGNISFKKVMSFNQPIPRVYQTHENFDVTFAQKLEIEFGVAPIGVRFAFEIGVYSYFIVGVNLNMNEKLMFYAVPGSRIYGTIAGGLDFSLTAITLSATLIAKNFTVVQAAVPVVAQLDNFSFDKNGFKADFKLFSNIELKVAKILLKLYVNISIEALFITVPIVELTQTLWDYDGIDPLEGVVDHVGTGLATDVTPCQTSYYGWELFCIKKELDIRFNFYGLTTAECSILDDEYKRRREVDGDDSFLHDVNEYRKVRGCVNDNYTFKNVTVSEWVLSEAQIIELQNLTFWRWDSRAILSQKLTRQGIIMKPTVSDVLRQAIFGTTEDKLQKAWLQLVEP